MKKTKDEAKSQEKINLSNFKGSGLYTTAKLNGHDVDCLVDTGATLSLVSTRVWNMIDGQSHNLDEFSTEIVSASGNPIDIKGQTTVNLLINNNTMCTCVVIVADIEADVILGLDFMKKERIQIDIETNSLFIQGKKCPMNCYGSLGCYRIVVAEKIEVPARSEVLVQGKVPVKDVLKEDLCLIEPIEKAFETEKCIAAKSLVHGSQSIPLRMMNLTNEVQTVYPGTHVATASPVTEVQKLKSKSKCVRDNVKVPAHLRDLYTRTIAGLNLDQQRQVANLLSKYSDVFSKNDSDVGRTGIIKHKIPTGNAQPIKQPPRRVPVHMNAEVDSQITEMLDKDVIQPSKSPWASSIVLV